MGTLDTGIEDRLLAFDEAGIDVLELVEGKNHRPVLSCDKEGYFGKKLYVSITREMQSQLGIEKPSDYIVAKLREDGSGLVDLYLLSGLVPDEDWKIPGTEKGGPGFISRAAAGLHKYDGVENGEEAQAIAEEYPLEPDSLATSFFEHDGVDGRGELISTGILDVEGMKEKEVSTSLVAKRVVTDYPERLLRQWKQDREQIEREEGRQYPLLVVPNACAKLLGLYMSRNTNQPESLGRTITSGGICTIKMGEYIFEAFVVGALDGLGFSEELAATLYDGQEYFIDVGVHNRTLNIQF
jgi:hypothetical protein